ncbi:30S ribosomal protein S19 [Candidatus Woesearchaeota archaeon]|nr:30S ribosomal protein S19 [Candidatus Woesearchaeota archaeon]
MVKKEFKYRGKTLEELKNLSIEQFAELIPARARRSLKRGFTEQQKILLKKIRNKEQNIKTHCRDMIILPEMINMSINVHDGKNFIKLMITEEMIGCRLGEFIMTRKKISHSAPGIGATRSSASLSVK